MSASRAAHRRSRPLRHPRAGRSNRYGRVLSCLSAPGAFLSGLVSGLSGFSCLRLLGLVRLVGDDAVDLACAIGRALADHARRLAADFAGRRLALAELAHVGHGRGRSLHRFGGADLRQLVRIQASCPGAGAPAPARARTSNAAGTTSCDPVVRFSLPLRPITRTSSRLTALDKSQVFALRLIRRKFAKNAGELDSP